MTTTVPCPASSGAAAPGPHRGGWRVPRSRGRPRVRIAPTTTTGLGESTSRSNANAVSSITSVPWTTTAPAMSGRARAATQQARDLQQLGEREVRCRHQPPVDGLDRRRWHRGPGSGRGSPRHRAPGLAAPVTGSGSIEMVPPVKMTATRGSVGHSSCPGGLARGVCAGWARLGPAAPGHDRRGHVLEGGRLVIDRRWPAGGRPGSAA